VIGVSFNDGWGVRRRIGPFEGLAGEPPAFEPVHLPHDAMLAAGRDPLGDPYVAFFRPGAYEYQKRFVTPEAWRDQTVVVRFDGIYRDAAVFVNDEPAGHLASGYGELALRLDDFLRYGEENVLHVECRTGTDSRWYSGAGIYRDVTLFVGEPVHVPLDGLRITNGADGLVSVDVAIENHTARRRTIDVTTELLDGDILLARDKQPVTVHAGARVDARARLLVTAPRWWDLEDPHLYTCRVRAGDDVTATAFGIRTVSADPRRGFRLNGQSIKLRGACIHHDNGVLGAATFRRAEERRVERLKAAGFNALRMAHHPASRALLDACDRIGMLVMDEAWDAWRDAKRDNDHALHFPTQWERDLDSMVAKDRNHPSVALYSIGNEIPEIGTVAGASQGRAIVERLRRLDPTRLVTNGVNLLLPVLSDGRLLNVDLGNEDDVVASDEVTRRTEEAFAVLDVAGYNYAEVRYEADGARFPNRVIVGSETFPRRIDRNWRLVLDHDHVIGDFTWTGWDYLGEVGIGRILYDGDVAAQESGVWGSGYPMRYASCGDIDITGRRLPISYYREIVFGLRSQPFIAVRPPAHHGARKLYASNWSWSSAVESWTWDGDEDRPVTIEVYAPGDEVELLQDGRSLGRVATERFTARFETTYEPGELVAIAFVDGTETGRTALRSAAGSLRLDVQLDGPVGDVAFVTIDLVDDEGTLHSGADRTIEVTVDGPGVLQGLGTAAPSSEESFLEPRCTSYRGRALAVVRPTGAGPITVSVSAEACEAVQLTFAGSPEP
jgi:beta-galactosidase